MDDATGSVVPLGAVKLGDPAGIYGARKRTAWTGAITTEVALSDSSFFRALDSAELPLQKLGDVFAFLAGQRLAALGANSIRQHNSRDQRHASVVATRRITVTSFEELGPLFFEMTDQDSLAESANSIGKRAGGSYGSAAGQGRPFFCLGRNQENGRPVAGTISARGHADLITLTGDGGNLGGANGGT